MRILLCDFYELCLADFNVTNYHNLLGLILSKLLMSN